MRFLLVTTALAATLLATRCATPSSAPSVPSASSGTTTLANAPAIAWHRWDKDAFERARSERRIVVVAIQTQWCHWCHVMDEETWSDPAIRSLVDARFIAIREDADARPDLAERYADWGWPALALLTPDGAPITELRGFQEKGPFLAVLRDLARKLDAGEALGRSVAPQVAPGLQEGALAAIREHTAAQLHGFWDEAQGGWGKPQKYPFWAPIEASLAAAALRGDDDARRRALFTLAQARALIDPVDGGMFQYSLEGKWTAPHYEKLAELNGALLGSYALALTAASTPEERTEAVGAGRALHRWMTTTMRDTSGAFFANQDADVGTRGERPHMVGKQYYALDASARAQAGAPFVDRHIYASHNGRMIAGLARFAGAVSSTDAALADAMLADAITAADVVVASHGTARGFVHAAPGDGGLLHLADQIAMGQAFVELYEATGDAKWRTLAFTTARNLVAALWDENRGAFVAHTVDATTPLDVRSPMRANAEAARLALKVGRLEGDAELTEKAQRALRSFASPALVSEEGRIVGEYLLAVEEALAEPLHFAIVGPGDTSALRKAALAVHAPHRIVEQHEPGKRYPDLGKPALYVCGASFCSPPITDPAIVAKKAGPFLKPRS